MGYYRKTVVTPVGELELIASDKGLSAILWENEGAIRIKRTPIVDRPDHPVLLQTARQLKEYFAGERRVFDLPLDFSGTDFQKKVWAALLTIPFGETRSYAEIAAQVGSPAAVRAVGAANGKNPVSIVAPCHRVIGSNGKLTGFAGGLEVKAFLLSLENTTLL
ncbi:methylated-DNA--protein-cysteine methyltransferase [Izhakiella australiensis]|uniref:Methylated-DNA--protein-cysteine methyltransferase n=1 Tax=Izhakiella australiensis TaxID=1926881 RepID=A0A1S8YIL9_9GAMM|nr:methylated-DNA--[protein]-cysteine S-methyltransferase [Izhakiella australiensis]OON38900.1 methylated-DNA--protein-cysteine methyltransferase [Izhakiella australiensis]